MTVSLRPGNAGKSVLLVVTGLTPQVVTETVYALMRESSSGLPDEVHIISTAEGARRAQLMLLTDEPGWLRRLCRDYGLPPIRCDETTVHVLRDASGEALDDIRSAADNAVAADQIAELVRGITSDPETRLHVSIAGGRKTLGFFAGYALSLWGRPQDRLSHILVNEPFESSWEFFYPTPNEHVIKTRDGGVADSSKATVTLADLPFVRLRHGLPQGLLNGTARFAQAVAAAQGHLGPAELVIDADKHRIEAAGRTVQLPPAELAFLAWFARRAKAGLPSLPCPPDGAPSTEHAQAYLNEYKRIRGFMNDDEPTLLRYQGGMKKADFEERKSKLKRVLMAELGAAAMPYLIVGEGRGPMRYRLSLAADAIRFASVNETGTGL